MQSKCLPFRVLQGKIDKSNTGFLLVKLTEIWTENIDVTSNRALISFQSNNGLWYYK